MKKVNLCLSQMATIIIVQNKRRDLGYNFVSIAILRKI